MFGRRKKTDKDNHGMLDKSDNSNHEITILVTDEDKTGSDVMNMSDFFSVALQEMSKELISAAPLASIEELPISDLSIINEAIQAIGMFRSSDYDLILDFSSLPKDILDKYKAGKLVLGESRQVEGNLRAVLIDPANNNQRVKDLTLKKAEHVQNSADISRDILNQLQLRQISEKLDYMISDQEYLIDFTRNQAILRPFLDARDNILKAQSRLESYEQKVYLSKAADKLQSAINSVYVDLNTIEGHLAEEANKKWYKFPNRKKLNTQISRIALDTKLLTKYVGMQMQVYHYLGDNDSSKRTLDTYRSNINRFFENGIVSPNKSLALFIHENVEYSEGNMDCWYYMEERMKPLLDPKYDEIQSESVFVLTGGEEDE